jgi:hypothetical protein
MKNQKGNSLVVMLAVALGSACVQSAPAQSFKKVNVSGNAPLVQVASGGASVWALASNGNPYILRGNSFALANTISLSQIAVGGGSSAQPDAVWALNSSGNIFRASRSGSTWTFSQVPGALDLIEVGPGYQDHCHPYEVWGLNPGAQIYRYNFCGNNFDPVTGLLCDIHVGGGDIWGAECGPKVYRFDFSTGVFDPITDPFGSFPALTVGPNGVWAIDTGGSDDYQYDEFTGTFFLLSLGFLTQMQAGGNGVWGLDPSGNIFRLEPSTLRFIQVPGSLVSISVGSGGGVWGINSSHQVLKFTMP